MKFFIYSVFSFIVISFLGWLWDLFWVYCEKKTLRRDSFLKGPWYLHYGLSVTFLMLTHLLFEKWYLVVILGLFMSVVLQLFLSITMENIFKRRWRDYSHNILNYKGKICLKSVVLLTLFSSLSLYFLLPLLEYIILILPFDYLELYTWIVLFVLLVDFIISFFIEFTSATARNSINDYKLK